MTSRGEGNDDVLEADIIGDKEEEEEEEEEKIIKHMLHIACKVVLNLIKSGNRMVINFAISTRGFVKV